MEALASAMCPGHDERLAKIMACETRSRINSGDYALECGSSQSHRLLPTWVISCPIAPRSPCCDPQTPHSHTEHFKLLPKDCGSGSKQCGLPPSIPHLAPSSLPSLNKNGRHPCKTLRVQRRVGQGSEFHRTWLLRRIGQEPVSQGAFALLLLPRAAMTALWGRHCPFIMLMVQCYVRVYTGRSSGSDARILASLKAS